MLVSVRRSRKAGKDHERERQRAVAETKRMNKQMTNVLESPITAKHLIISLGEKTFLALPKRGMLGSLSWCAYTLLGSPLGYSLECAARRALACAGMDAADLDLIVVATLTPEIPCPRDLPSWRLKEIQITEPTS